MFNIPAEAASWELEHWGGVVLFHIRPRCGWILVHSGKDTFRGYGPVRGHGLDLHQRYLRPR